MEKYGFLNIMALICLQACSLLNLLFFVIFLFSNVIQSDEDYYNILGLSRNANSEEIKRAYRQLARQWYVQIYCKKL